MPRPAKPGSTVAPSAPGTTSPPALAGRGGELHQVAPPGRPTLTSNQGVPLSDNQNSLRGGSRGPGLLEDFLLREKITHFDHERIPERVVHARGSAAHGTFECTRDCSAWTRANFLSRPGQRTPVFARLSTVAGGAGSADTPRDVRGFAVKFYTEEGNFDLVGNNIPVFFIQDAIKFPDLVHAVKMEPDRGFPQAGSAHDTFWDFISLMPEAMHMVMWAMSDRTLPRSLRMIDGFGVHTFRFVDAQGQWRFVKFHWRSLLGVESTTWDEAVKIAGADPDYHRRDLWEAIARGDAPAWDLGVQVFDEAKAATLPIDVLDPTKLIPEELIPVEVIGRMTLDRNPGNFFAENEQVAFCPAHLVPGIDFSEDPLLQGRLFSYTDTQLSRLGSPNFHQLPINQARCPMRNFQRDATMQMGLPAGRVNYEPNTLNADGPRESPNRGFVSVPAEIQGPKTRSRPRSFVDHYSQARQFYRSLTPPEQQHMSRALAFELGKLEVKAIRQRMLGHLLVIDRALSVDVASRLGVDPEAIPPASPAVPPQALPLSAALSAQRSRAGGLRGRCIGLLVTDGANARLLQTLRRSISKAGAAMKLITPTCAGVWLSDRTHLPGEAALDASPSCLFVAVAVLGSDAGMAPWLGDAAALSWLRDAWRHLKVIGLEAGGQALAAAAGIGHDEAVLALADGKSVEALLACAAMGKHLARDGAPGTDA